VVSEPIGLAVDRNPDLKSCLARKRLLPPRPRKTDSTSTSEEPPPRPTQMENSPFPDINRPFFSSTRWKTLGSLGHHNAQRRKAFLTFYGVADCAWGSVRSPNMSGRNTAKMEWRNALWQFTWEKAEATQTTPLPSHLHRASLPRHLPKCCPKGPQTAMPKLQQRNL
jgi:hypothetical protein